MASRVNYYRVADLLGSTHAPIDTSLFPHSWLSFRIRARFMELNITREWAALHLLSFSNVLGNPGLNARKAENIFADLYGKLHDSIPYFKQAVGETRSSIDRQREELTQAYLKMVEESRKKKMDTLEQDKTDG